METKEGFEITAQSKIVLAPVNFDMARNNDEKERYSVKVDTDYQNYQYGITYKKNKQAHIKSIGNIDKLRDRIGKDPLRVTFFGDSITAGANATSIYTHPNQPGYVDLVMSYLSAYYPNKWYWRNNAVGGWSTINAVAALDYRMLNAPSDLYVIAFGMNDAGEIPPEDYKNNIINLVDRIKNNNPNASVMLIGSSRFNPKWNLPHNYFTEYVEILKQIAINNKDIVYADVTGAWDYLLKNKNYYDLTGNGLNHPNDFGHRVMAEVVLTTLLGKKP